MEIKNAKQIFKEYKSKEKKGRVKICHITYSLLAVMLLLIAIVVAIFDGILTGVMIIIVGSMILLCSYLFVLLIFKLYFDSHYIEVCVDGIEIAAFIGYGESAEMNGVSIHLIVNGNEESRFVKLNLYSHGDIFTIFELIRYSYDRAKEKKTGGNLAVFTKKVGGKTISAIYEKYTRKLVIKVDDKVYKI